MPGAPARGPFGPELFRFLRELKAHNTREWFAAHKDEYEDHVRGPALDFVADFATRLERISSHFVADPRPAGGSLFRIHRDTRVSKDKSPYKTYTGIQSDTSSGAMRTRPASTSTSSPARCSSERGSGIRTGRRSRASGRRSPTTRWRGGPARASGTASSSQEKA